MNAASRTGGPAEPSGNGRIVIGVITELPSERLPTGVRRRAEQYEQHHRTLGHDVRRAALFDMPSETVRGDLRRAASARLPIEIASCDEVIVVGLGSVSAMTAAKCFSRQHPHVSFDQCDSIVLQAGAALRTRQPRELVWAAWRIALRRTLPRRVTMLYISARDKRLDALVNLLRRTAVVPPSVDLALKEMPPVVMTKLTRITAPGDFASPHLDRGFAMLCDALGARSDPRVDLYGPSRPRGDLPAGMRFEGWAASIESVYEGDSAVFIANVRGSGVPNKLLEAIAARRPVIVHRSMLRRTDRGYYGWVYSTVDDIRVVLSDIRRGVHPPLVR